ncbi:MAG TPA: protein translocase subunit SecD [Longimicrobiales bacterium]|nr:protein translocase subunit SecD [Longimicrobiales bacterium]
MLGTLRGRAIVILAVLAGAAYFLWDTHEELCEPTAAEAAAGREASGCSIVALGLDLQGGSHFVLEVDDPEGTLTVEARRDAIDRAETIIRNRIDELGVREPLIQRVGADRLIVELAGSQDPERAKGVIRANAFLEFQLVREGPEFAAALPRIDRAVVAQFGPNALGDRVIDTPDGGGQSAVEDLLFGGGESATLAPADDSAAAPEDSAATPDQPETEGASDVAPIGATGAQTVESDQVAAAEQDSLPEDTTVVSNEPEDRPLTALLNNAGLPGVFAVRENDRELVERFLANDAVRRAMPRDTELLWSAETTALGAEPFWYLYVLDDEPAITGEYLEDAIPNIDPQFNETIVQFEFNRRGGRIFERFTGQHVQDYMAIVLDDKVFSAPVIQSRIGRTGQIELGASPLAEAQDLALVLRAGALPAPLSIIEERTVGPSLGHDSIEKGRLAGIVGIVLVVGLMVLYYKVAGLLAVVALGVYVVLVLGGLAAFGATLTLPGIAGLILSIGMAVDANVLIFERVREELAAGKTVRTAVDEGFAHAMSAIIDSNLTTLLTALILYRFGTGPVRGFAVTLSVGIIASFFSAVYVTRTLFLTYVSRRSAARELSI